MIATPNQALPRRLQVDYIRVLKKKNLRFYQHGALSASVRMFGACCAAITGSGLQSGDLTSPAIGHDAGVIEIGLAVSRERPPDSRDLRVIGANLRLFLYSHLRRGVIDPAVKPLGACARRC